MEYLGCLLVKEFLTLIANNQSKRVIDAYYIFHGITDNPDRPEGGKNSKNGIRSLVSLRRAVNRLEKVIINIYKKSKD